MPRVFSKTKNRGGHHVYTCDKCRKPIESGDEYLTWKFNRGLRFFRHLSCGYPRRGELTNSKMGPVWDAVDEFDVSGCQTPDEIKEALEYVASVAREVGAEYGESADNIEQAFPSGNPTSEACRAVSEELDAWADELEGWEPDDEFDSSEYTPATVGDAMEDWLSQQRDAAQDKVNEQPEYQG